MELALLVYLCYLFEKIKNLADKITAAVAIVSGILLLVYVINLKDFSIAFHNVRINQSDCDDDSYLRLHSLLDKFRKAILCICLPFIIFAKMLPTGNTYNLMVGAYFTQQTIQHPETQEIFTKVKGIILKKLDDVEQQLNIQLKESKEQ